MTDKEKLKEIKKLADAMYYAAFNMTTDASLLRKAMDDYHQFIINEYHKEEQIIKELQEEPVSEEQVKKSLISKHDDKTCKENGNSLTQEPVSDDLGKVGSLKSLKYYPEKKTTNKTGKGVFDANMPRRKAYLRGFKDGAHAHKELIANKPVSEDLDEACEQLAENARKHKAETSSPFFSPTDYKQGVMDGSKWKIEKLMKDATPVTVHIDAGGYPYIPQLELYDYDKDVPLAKEGDKYKVILIKEE